ncbi:MAG: sulfate ABC transporter ATP-binding protein [Syntrophales bacterium]|jgi:sulfate transport system ATP-binding protein
MDIEIVSVSKQFGSFKALKDVSLMIPSGKLVALLGPSGCGKTTLLRIIAGLESPESGSILFNGEEVNQRHVAERNIGFVFQHYALFRHMSVFENVAFGLRVKARKIRPKEEQIGSKVFELLRLIQLDHLAEKYPAQLSGGQRQRVALARALAVEPQVLLLDEPFGALDAKVRLELRRWLRRLHDEIHVTSIFVTHDQEEALELSDRVVVMNEGKVEQIGTPEEVYDHPATPFTFDFLGNVNLFHGRVHKELEPLGDVELVVPENLDASDSPVIGYVRSHDIEVEREPVNSASFKAEVRHVHTIGPMVKVELFLCETKKTVEVELSRDVSKRLALQKGETVFVHPRKLRVFEGDYQV